MSKKNNYIRDKKMENEMKVNPKTKATAKLDDDADKSGTDNNADCTQESKDGSRFDKPEKETSPDKTGVDTEADKTKPGSTGSGLTAVGSEAARLKANTAKK